MNWEKWITDFRSWIQMLRGTYPDQPEGWYMHKAAERANEFNDCPHSRSVLMGHDLGKSTND